MVLCVEALVNREGWEFSIKLEDQVLVTEDGHENPDPLSVRCAADG